MGVRSRTAKSSEFWAFAPGCGPGFMTGQPSPLRGAADRSAAPRPTSFPAGATKAGRRGAVNEGTDLSSVPRVRSAGGGDECRRDAPNSGAAVERTVMVRSGHGATHYKPQITRG